MEEVNDDELLEYVKRLSLETTHVHDRSGGTREINTIIRDYGFDMDKKQLYKMYQYCTKEQFNYLMIDLIVPIEKRFRKFLFEIVNPHSLPQYA